jgi:hypothetical protein
MLKNLLGAPKLWHVGIPNYPENDYGLFNGGVSIITNAENIIFHRETKIQNRMIDFL